MLKLFIHEVSFLKNMEYDLNKVIEDFKGSKEYNSHLNH